MPLKYWDEAFTAATYLINRLPSKVIGNSTPLERLYNQTHDYNSLKKLGVLATQIYVHIIATSSSFDLPNVFFMAIVIFTKGTNA